jgi:predicted DNA-binding protein
MPSRGTPKVTLRLPEEMWRRFGEVAAAAGVDRATLLRAWIAWYIRDPEAKAPQRP